MLFNSIAFAIFFPVVTLLYFALPDRWRWLHLLVASCIFYMGFIPVYILILFFTIGVDYCVGLLIGGAQGNRRRLYLIFSIAANVGVLALFKYYAFINANLEGLAEVLGWNYGLPALSFVLPIGLSFHTFQALSYTIEVYRGHQQPERHLGIFALYVMFYPQLVAGPIERPQNLLHQFREQHRFDYARVTDGLKLMAWGFFKKLVIADNVAVLVNRVYDAPDAYTGTALLIATVLFSFQIYCDFSGYSDIALGSAQVMGFRLMPNFRQPYLSQSISEFWRRWHISLSTWFRDYVYIPLGGNRTGRLRWYSNLLIVFLLSGLWHGANWTFVVWGALHGIFLVVADATGRLRAKCVDILKLDRWPTVLRVWRTAATFALVSFAWIFFRAPDFTTAMKIIRGIGAGLVSGVMSPGSLLPSSFVSLHLYPIRLALLSVVILMACDLLQQRGSVRARLATKPIWFRWSCYYALVLWTLLVGNFVSAQFIYFQF